MQAESRQLNPGKGVTPDMAVEVRSTVNRRGWFSKYSNPQKAVMIWKASIALTLVGFVLATTGLAIDRFDLEEEVNLTLNGHSVVVPSVAISSTTIELGTDGCDEGWKVDPVESELHSRHGMSFKKLAAPSGDLAAEYFADNTARVISSTHMGEFSAFYNRGMFARILSIIAVALQGIALVWTLVLKVPPSPFFYNRPLFGQTHREHLLGSVYQLILILSGILLFAANAVMSTIMAPLMARVANFALDWCETSPFDDLPRQQSNLEYMRFLGRYVQDNANLSGVTYMTYSVSIALIFFQSMLGFYLAIREVKSQSRVNYRLPDSQLRLLPWYSKFFSLKSMVLLLLIAIVANCATAYSARVRGFPLNLYFYENTFGTSEVGETMMFSKSWSLQDVVLDRIHKYVIDKSLVKLLLSFWIPSIVVVGFGTVDYFRFVAKVVQILAVLMLASAIIGISTVAPTPAFVFQKPQCYEAPHTPPTFAQFFSISESCNDQIYSLYSVLIGLPVMVMWFYVRYGAVRRKRLAYAALAVVAAGSLFIVVATRLQYTVDVYIGAVVTVMYCLSQSAAFKLLFRFGIVHPGMRHKAPIILNEKISPTLDEILQRLDLHFMAGKDAKPLTRDDLLKIQSEFNLLVEAVDYARDSSLQELQAVGGGSSSSSSDGDDDDVESFSGEDSNKLTSSVAATEDTDFHTFFTNQIKKFN